MEPERWQRIEQLYYAALERAAPQRAAFLADSCGDDAGLRREVEGLLAANEQASAFLARPALELEARNLALEEAAAPPGVQVGQTVSHYHILSRLGAGGMGEVFLAEDRILGRRVALKLLPVRFVEDAERLQRFIREAKAASALNHPNIITIYEIGEVANATGKTHFIATEFIEGETLRTWRADDERGLPQILSVAIQAASALAAAHKAGVVHRDIKPENVMVRPDGVVKVLDFGLVKLTARPAAGPDAQGLSQGVKTRPGMILGTLRYMSPEQARGRGVDARSDIFSLGAVLYELLTGQPLFAGDTDADVTAAILHKEMPALAAHLATVPAELERILQKALAKDREQRYQDARDLEIDLQSLKQDSELNARLARSGPRTTGRLAAQSTGAMTAPRFSLRQLLLGLAVALLLAGGIGWLLVRHSRQVQAPPPASLKTVEVVTWQSAPGEVYSTGSFSHDGKWVAFTSTQGGNKNIWIKLAAAGGAEPSTRDEFKNENPIWSPNDDEIAFTSMRGGHLDIWRKPPFGGAPKLLMKLARDEGSIKLGRWSTDGATIYYESKQNLYGLDVNSGRATQLTDLNAVNVIAYSLSVSPDERYVAYVTGDDAGDGTLYVLPLRGGAARPVARLSGGARETVWHPDGERIFCSASVNGTYQIFVADVSGHKPVQLTFDEKDCMVQDVSADGTRLLYGSSEEKSDIWRVSVARAEESLVVSDIGFEFWPDVAPDGRTVAYQAARNLSEGNKILHSSIVTRTLDVSAQPAALTEDAALPRWSPDGAHLGFLRVSNQALGLWTVKATGGEEKLLATEGLPSLHYSMMPYHRLENRYFDWSRDGRTLAYCSSRGGQSNLWLVAVDGSAGRQITANDDSNQALHCPLWAEDGKRLAYSSNPRQFAAGEKVTYRVWVTEPETKNSRVVFEANSFLRLIGWLPGSQELLLATLQKRTGTTEPTEVQLLRVSVRTGEPRTLATIRAAYLYNIELSADGRLLAFSSHQEDKDNLYLLRTDGGEPKQLTANNDPGLYFSSLAWSPDRRAVYYGKQVRYSQLWMIANFK